ncbi:MAG: glycosyltransferase family 4 protein [Nitrospirales bacterium]
MKIAYVTTYNAADVHQWSGLGYNMAKSLTDADCELEYIGNLNETFSLLLDAKTRFYRQLCSKRYLRDREPCLLKSYAKQVSNALRSSRGEIVFSPGSIPIAYLKTDKPIVFWTDATFVGISGFYPEYSNLCEETIKNGNQMEQEALSRCSYAIYGSEWAAKTAVDNFIVDARKIKVVPFGANINCSRTNSDIEEMVSNRDAQTIKLLFCGVDWHRKGGAVVLEIAKMLFAEGVDVELDVVGCRPPGPFPDFVKIHGFVSKTTAEGRQLLDSLFSHAHFLINPARAECYGIVYAEASSFGLPSIAIDVGGIPTVVSNGVNGQLFSLADSADKYCSYIKDVMSSRDQYRDLALSSFKEYENKLNWSVAGKTVRGLIRGLID